MQLIKNLALNKLYMGKSLLGGSLRFFCQAPLLFYSHGGMMWRAQSEQSIIWRTLFGLAICSVHASYMAYHVLDNYPSNASS